MMKRTQRLPLFKLIRNISLCLLLVLTACTPAEKKDLKKAQSEIEKGHFQEALVLLEKIMARYPDADVGIQAARDAAKISYYDLKNFEKAYQYYKHLVMYSSEASERVAAQKQIAAIYFDQLADYPKAIIELNKVISMLKDPKEMAQYKMSLARAYYYQNNFLQAENEVEEFLRHNIGGKQEFDMRMLKGNIYLAKKDIKQAANLFKEIIQKFPDFSRQENVELTLAVCYEELADYKNAITVLENMKAHHPVPDYIEIRIKRLAARLKNQPGAKGYKK